MSQKIPSMCFAQNFSGKVPSQVQCLMKSLEFRNVGDQSNSSDHPYVYEVAKKIPRAEIIFYSNHQILNRQFISYVFMNILHSIL